MPAFRLGYRSCLDGLRGVAILIVLAVHLVFPDIRARGTGAAFVGVDIFFVLSGFLITSLLLEEWDDTNQLHLARFYARRALRLLPALFAVLGAFVAYSWVIGPSGSGAATVKDALLPLCYVANWTLAMDLDRPVLFAHTWSLSIEEQFYLLWPLALRLLLKRTSSRSSLVSYLGLLVFLAVLARALLVASGALAIRITSGTDTRADSLLLGCLLGAALSAGLVPKTHRQKSWVRSFAWFSVLALLFLCLRRDFHGPVTQCLGFFAVSVFAAAVILEAVTCESGLLAKLLSQRWLVFVGKVSYGLYLWHYPIFFLADRAWSWPVNLLISLPLTAAATMSSYYFLERPLLRFKAKFKVRAIGPSADAS